jgi:phage-related protein
MPNRAISVASIIEKNKLASSVPFILLAKIEIYDSTTQAFVETVYIANNSENVTFGGQTYVAFPFTIELRYEAGAIPDISMSAVDFQKVLLGKLNTYGGATGSRVTIVIANTGNLGAGAEIEEVFEVLSASANEWKITLRLGAESVIARQFPGRTQMKDRCSWRYKSAECGYTGALPSCDLSLQGANGCAAHNNTVNFGGFPAIQNRGIRYG